MRLIKIVFAVLWIGMMPMTVAYGTSAQATGQNPAPEKSVETLQPITDATTERAASTSNPVDTGEELSVLPDDAMSDGQMDNQIDDPSGAQFNDKSDLLPHNLSPWGMFMNADWVVKAVMIGLAFASLVTWTILLVKGLELLAAVRQGKRLHQHLSHCSSLSKASEQNHEHPAELTHVEAEFALSKSVLIDGEGVKERVASRLDELMIERTGRVSNGIGILATIGNTAPFVGLFGTVWGIMNSFIGISQSHTTNLAVVAPGIAEALLATALGLVAAIPAVIVYNLFTRRIGAYKALLADITASVLRLVSRELSEYKVTQSSTEKV